MSDSQCQKINNASLNIGCGSYDHSKNINDVNFEILVPKSKIFENFENSKNPIMSKNEYITECPISETKNNNTSLNPTKNNNTSLNPTTHNIFEPIVNPKKHNIFEPIVNSQKISLNIVNSKDNMKHNKNISNIRYSNNFILDDNMGDLNIVDTRKYIKETSTENISENISEKTSEKASEKCLENVIIDNIPEKISGTYNENYNIIYVDDIIRKKLHQEKFTHLNILKLKHMALEATSKKPQSYVLREQTLDSMKKIKDEIDQIQNGEKLQTYIDSVKDIIDEYRKYNGTVRTVVFNIESNDEFREMDENSRNRVYLIEKYLDIASKYINIEVIRINNRPSDICCGCGGSLAKVFVNDEGTIKCPNPDCQTEHNVIIRTKLAKDGPRINISGNPDDESIDNFLRAFIRYQGLQLERPDISLYTKLDEYFISHDRPTGIEIRELPLNNMGRRGDTDHRMLWTALAEIGCSEYYEDTNLIGHIYWGWKLRNVMQYKETIISQYNKTQKVFYEIPPEKRGRNSSLGTQYRLWRHLQLVGHDCHINEFKIAENSESLRTHNKLWRTMCEGANDNDIYYIP